MQAIMQINDIELSVLVKGRSIPQYKHRGQVFVEGREGSAYEIELRNRNPFRVEAILSVDGLSVLDGKAAGPGSRGYVIEANGSLRVPGWKVDDTLAAAFTFAGKQKSYASTSGDGEARNNGVIGALVYREQPVQTTSFPRTVSFPLAGVTFPAYPAYPAGYAMAGAVSTGVCNPSHLYGVSVGDLTKGMGEFSFGSILSNSVGSLQEPTIGSTVRSFAAANPVVNSVNATTSFAATTVAPAPVEQALGTGFGEATEFATSTTSFTRADLLAVMELYYDDARALRARGIVIGRREEKFAHKPQAFPLMPQPTGCAPPPGWSRHASRKP